MNTGAESAPVFRVRVDLAYDGTGFRGLAENAGVRTVVGELRAGLERLTQQPIALAMAGRTDAGVHAAHQVLHFDLDPASGAAADRFRPDAWARTLTRWLGPEISVLSMRRVPGDFHARFSAAWRRYRYTVRTAAVADPFLARYSWHLGRALDIAAMNDAAAHLVGVHDFSTFCRRPTPVPGASPADLTRHVTEAHWRPVDDEAWFEIQATAFCHHMVRAITATLVDVGLGRRDAGDVADALAARDRSRASTMAPPHGLSLIEVGYPPGS